MKSNRLPRNNKTDKGFEIFYYNLSYRRKFIRTIWVGAFGAVMLLLITALKLFLPETPGFLSRFSWFYVVLIAVIFTVVLVVQLIYTYIRWKSEEKKSKENQNK